jgi:hypothetical protein
VDMHDLVPAPAGISVFHCAFHRVRVPALQRSASSWLSGCLMATDRMSCCVAEVRPPWWMLFLRTCAFREPLVVVCPHRLPAQLLHQRCAKPAGVGRCRSSAQPHLQTSVGRCTCDELLLHPRESKRVQIVHPASHAQHCPPESSSNPNEALSSLRHNLRTLIGISP